MGQWSIGPTHNPEYWKYQCQRCGHKTSKEMVKPGKVAHHVEDKGICQNCEVSGMLRMVGYWECPTCHGDNIKPGQCLGCRKPDKYKRCIDR